MGIEKVGLGGDSCRMIKSSPLVSGWHCWSHLRLHLCPTGCTLGDTEAFSADFCQCRPQTRDVTNNGVLLQKIYNSFWSWIRFTELIKIWFSLGSSSPIYSVTGCTILHSMAMKLYFTLEIGDESQNQTWTWILTSSVILIQLKKLLYAV